MFTAGLSPHILQNLYSNADNLNNVFLRFEFYGLEWSSIQPLGPYSVLSVGAVKAVSLAIGHNPGRVATPTQDISKLTLILPTSE